MDFRFTEDQQDLIEAAKTVFDGENTLERMRGIVAGNPPIGLWKQFADLGLFGILASEENDGLSQPLVVMAGIAEAAGYAGLPEPYVDVAGIVVPLLSQLKETELLEKVISGEISLGLITPLSPHVNCGEWCDHFIITSKSGGRCVARSEVTLEPRNSIDPLRWLYKADLQGEQNELADMHGAVLTAAQLIGLSMRMVEMSVEYAKDRHQFGKPIGSFQAVKHQLANVHTQIEFTRPIIHLAALKGGAAVHNAKIAAIDTAMLAAETAIQVHGGMGYTYEVDLHLFMKRAWALCGDWGDRHYHMKKLEDYVLNGGANLGPGETFKGET
ncbi:MAG: acyl-CoA dehydrogenase family protein [Hellea sp.]